MIALVITIVVLLILAGVSISLVVGDNGVLTQASSTVVTNREAKAKEEVQLAWSSAETKYYTDWAKNTSVDKDDYYGNAELLTTYVADTGEIKSSEPNGDGSWTVKYIAKDQNKTYTFIIDERGNVSRKSGITLDKENLELQIVDGTPTTEVLTATVEGLEGTISWEVEGTESAKVNLVESGDKKTAALTGVSATTGTVTVRATCGGESASCTVRVISTVHVSSISSITPSSVTVNRGSKQTITAIVNEGATERLNWSVNEEAREKVTISAPEVDEINNTQTVEITVLSTATSEEQIIVTAQNKAKNLTSNNTATLTVNVPVEGVSITPTTAVAIAPEETATLTAIIEPEDASNKNVSWSITPASGVATLSSTSGSEVTITGVGAGTATVRVTTEEGSKIAEKNITVKTPVLSYYGTQVATGVTSVNGKSIADNWKIFYADADNVYLIYGDYYPANVQTEITSGTNSTIYIPAHTYNSTTKKYDTDSTYTYSVNSDKDKNTLLRYLKNNTGYDYTSYTTNKKYDSVGAASAAASQYTSWKNLLTAFGNGNNLAKKATSVQGSPTFEMWVDSWNEKYNATDGKVAKLRTFVKGSNTNGYLIGDTSTTPTTSISNTVGNQTAQTGYYDTLYYPHRDTQTTAYGYWLASPGGGSANTMCNVSYSGYVSCNYYYDDYSRAARPVVSIPKSDFNAQNVEGITID